MENRISRYLPNAITVFRLSLVFPFLLFIHDIIVHNCTNLFSLIIFVSILVSDVLDGYVARKLNCATETGAKLDIFSDAFYSVSTLILFVYFKMVPAWFPVLMVLKLAEFIVTSKIMRARRGNGGPVFFDKTGKTAVIIVMLMPGIFVFRCVIADYRLLMTLAVYSVTALLAVSFFSRMIYVLKPAKTET